MKNQDNEKLPQLFRNLDKNLRTKEEPDSTKSAELIEQLPELNFRTTLSSGSLIDLLVHNGNKHTQQAAYKKFANEDKIFVAACFGWKKTLTKLLDKTEVNASLPSGQTLLYLAAQYGKKSTVALLLERKADVNNQTILHEIIQDDNYEALYARMSGKERVNPFVTSALCAATQGKHYEVMELLLDAKAKVDQRSLYGKLLDSGTKTNGFQAFHCDGVIQGSNPSYVDAESYTYSAMHIAAAIDDEAALALLKKYGADLNQSARTDQFSSSTPLHVAVQSGSVNAVDYLIRNKADVNRKAVDCIVLHHELKQQNLGLTPLHFAAEQGDTRTIILLLKNGAQVNALGMKNASFSPPPTTPLDYAAMNDHLEAFDTLAQQGAVIADWTKVLENVITDYSHRYKKLSGESDSPSNQIELLKRLLARKEKPNLKYDRLLDLALKPTDENNFTPNYAVADLLLSHTHNWDPYLNSVIAKNDLEHFKLLLERQDKPSINFDKFLNVALKPTYENKHKPDLAIVQLLIAQGARVTKEQIAQTQQNGLDYLIEPLKAAKAEQDKAVPQKPVAQESSPVRVGFFSRVFGGCCGKGAVAEHQGAVPRS